MLETSLKEIGIDAQHAPPDELRGWLDQCREQTLMVYALINPVEQAPRAKRAWRPPARYRAINLFSSRTRERRALDIGPELIEVPFEESLAAQVLDAVQRQSAEIPQYMLIASSLHLDQLSLRLARRFDVSADGADMMLRLWDSRIFAALHRELLPGTREVAMAFGYQAIVADRRGGVEMLGLNCPPADPLEAEPFRLSRDEMKALASAARSDAMLGMLRQQSPELLDSVEDAQRYTLARLQLDECLQRGLGSPRDHALALSLAIEHGPEWWFKEEWATCVQFAQESTLLKAYLHCLEAA